VVILAVLDLTGALPLPAQHLVYRFGPDGEFHQIYVIGQVYAPDVVVWRRFIVSCQGKSSSPVVAIGKDNQYLSTLV
jgi:hypothetical protein